MNDLIPLVKIKLKVSNIILIFHTIIEIIQNLKHICICNRCDEINMWFNFN